MTGNVAPEFEALERALAVAKAALANPTAGDSLRLRARLERQARALAEGEGMRPGASPSKARAALQDGLLRVICALADTLVAARAL